MRDLTRYRTSFIRERVNLVNRIQKLLEGANIKLASVASDIMGMSGRAMLDAIVAGETDPVVMASLAKGKLCNKREQLIEALEGRVHPHQRFILAELLCQLDSLEETITRFNQQIEAYSQPFEAVIELLEPMPGVGRQTAEMLVAEIGIDMSRFPAAAHLAAWAGLAPGNYQSAGKTLSGKTRKGNQTLRAGLMQSAHVASRSHTYLAAQYRRIAARRGKKRARMAVAHSILVIAYHIIQRREPYRELGANYFDQQHPEKTAKKLVKRLERMGYQVSLQSQAASVA